MMCIALSCWRRRVSVWYQGAASVKCQEHTTSGEKPYIYLYVYILKQFSDKNNEIDKIFYGKCPVNQIIQFGRRLFMNRTIYCYELVLPHAIHNLKWVNII